MDKSKVKHFDGLAFLDELEVVYSQNELDGVVEMVKKTFLQGSYIRMDNLSGSAVGPVYQIKQVVLFKLNPKRIVFETGDKNSGTVIRSFNLPYVSIPFQIDIYGISVFKNKIK